MVGNTALEDFKFFYDQRLGFLFHLVFYTVQNSVNKLVKGHSPDPFAVE